MRNRHIGIALISLLVIALLAGMITWISPTAVEYNLEIDSTEGGSVTTPGETTFTYDEDEEVTLLAETNQGYRFVEWTGDTNTITDPKAAETMITMDDDYLITAVFEPTNDEPPEPPSPKEWDPQKQALLPDREFDTNWTTASRWYPALHRDISTIWGQEPTMISSPKDANESTMLGLSEGHPIDNGSMVLRCVFSKNEAGGVPLDFIVRLYDGDNLIEEWLEENISAEWTIREYELSNEVHDLDNLRVELTRKGETTAPENNLRQVLVSLVEMEIPYPDNFIFPYLNPATTTHAPESDTVQSPSGIQKGDVILVSSVNGEAADGFDLIHSQPTIEDASRPYNLRTWWKRAESNEPESYTFPNAEGVWAARISGAADLPGAVDGHTEPTSDAFTLPLGISTPSVNTPTENSLVIRISANNLYTTWTEPHQWLAWEDWPSFAASWRFQKETGPTGEEFHQTGSFIHWVAQTIAITPK